MKGGSSSHFQGAHSGSAPRFWSRQPSSLWSPSIRAAAEVPAT